MAVANNHPHRADDAPDHPVHTEQVDGQYSVQWSSHLSLEAFLKFCVDSIAFVDRSTSLTVYTTAGHRTAPFGWYLIERAVANLGSKLLPGPEYDDTLRFIHIHATPALTWQPPSGDDAASVVGLVFETPNPRQKIIEYVYNQTTE